MTTSNEIWKEIDGFQTYSVSDLGRVRNDETMKILKGGKGANGYIVVSLCKNGVKKTHCIHRLIAIAFIPNPDGKPCVDHRDNDKNDNRAMSLRWCTNEENNRNAQVRSNNTSGIKGVSWFKRDSKWRAKIKVNGVDIHLGYFDKIEDAILARQTYAKEAFGEFVNDCETL